MKKTILQFVIIYSLMISGLMFAGTGYSGGNGTQPTPYLIANATDLSTLSTTAADWVTGIYFKQTIDIDASGLSGFTPIGSSTTNFQGNYDGQGFVILNLSISSVGDRIGLFGVAKGATISNLGVTNVSIAGGTFVGGLVGQCAFATAITNCYSDGSVSGTSRVGGLVGTLYTSSTISISYSSASITAVSVEGGFVGEVTSGTISNCYSLGNVTKTGSGGNSYSNFCGYTSGSSPITIEYCYSIGSVTNTGGGGNPTNRGFLGFNTATSTTFTSNFFDQTTSGQTTPGATGSATGAITSVMKTQSTFDTGSSPSTDWDFTTIWQMIGTNYPDLVGNSNSALPVELTSFTGLVKNNSVVLSWETATEVNNYGFEVQRASSPTTPRQDGWEKIGFEQGYGNSNSAHNYSFTDKNSVVGNYSYRLKQIDTDGQYEYSDVVEISIIKKIPGNFRLAQNYPNPFNPSTTISYSIPLLEGVDVTSVQLRIYDILGRNVAELVKTKQSAGTYEVVFDASSLNSGIYFYHLNVVSDNGLFSQVRKMILLK